MQYLVVGGFTASISTGTSGTQREEEGGWCIWQARSWEGFLCNSLNPSLLPGKYCSQSSRYCLAIKEQQNRIYCHKATVCTQRASFS